MKKTTTIGIFLFMIIALAVGAIIIYYYTVQDLQIKPINYSKTKEVENHYIYNHIEHPEDAILIYLLTDGGQGAKNLVATWAQQVKNFNAVVVTDTRTLTERYELVASIQTMQQRFKPALTALVGFSSHGYFLCSIGLEGNNFSQVALVALGSHCRTLDVKKFSPALLTIPILNVIGENDSWARGEYHTDQDYVQEASQELKDQYSISQEVYYVPNIGHSYPVSAIPYILNWLLSKI